MIKKASTDFDMPIGKLKQIEDFLPPPDQLVFRKKTVKVTMALDERSVTFFKKIAKQNHVPYQTMIRNLITSYVAKCQAS